tara:strand:- start:1818 stop:2183 length:366 start_codon:yes stop_codon:yes gene_type:complete
MTHTVTLLADHKGYTKPRANGDEYMVDALINITAYVQGGIVVTASSLGLTSLTQVHLAGDEELGQVPYISITSLGNYANYAAGPPVINVDSQFTLILSTGAAQLGGTGDEGMVRVRAYGIL